MATRKPNEPTTAITIAQQPAALLPINSVQELQTLGAVLSQSNLFGKRNPAEGLAIVAMCQQKRISWLDFMQNFHMINGVVSKKTDAIIADFHRLGGKHKIIARTDEKAEAEFILGDCSYVSSLTWEECKSEPFIYVGNEKDILPVIERGETEKLVIKAKYRTPRARKQMLWARVVSDGIRVVAPECVQGIYTPEEVEDFTEVSPTASYVPPTQPAQPTVVSVAPSPIATSIEVCPVGTVAGKRWDEMDTDTLKQALNISHPLVTPEMKDYIRGLIQSRDGAAAVTPEVVS